MLLERKPAGWLVVLLCLGFATPPDAKSFVDEFVPRQLKEHQVPGAAVTVVTRDGPVFAAGYGVADLSTGRPVDPARTVFAPASVVKLITATAVMQLVEQGRVDLNADVNTYLTDFKIADAFPGRPVTMAHLLTHTAGFAASDFGTGAASPSEVHPLGAHLADHQPVRIRPPGTRAVYSNYGMGLAGHIVELRSGLPFHRYVQEHILDPLGMTDTTLAQPEPEHIAEALAPGYLLVNGRQIRATGTMYGHMPPHGAGFRSTATDMAKFMVAQLNGGGVILKPESVRLMQGRRFGNAEGTSGMGYGFQEYTRNGHRLLVHRGSIPGYFAILALLPDQGLGIYASYNGSGKGAPDSAWDLVNAFTDRFAASTPSSDPVAPAASLPDPAGFAGTYRSTLIDDTTDLSKISALMNVVTVSAAKDGTLTTTGPVTFGAAQTRQWTQIAPGLFQEKSGHRRIRFDADGVLATENPAGPLKRLAWYELPALHLGVLGLSLFVLLLSALAWPVVSVIGYVRRRPARAPRLAGLPGWATAALVVASAGALAALFADFDANQAAYFLGGSPLFSVILTLPVLAAVATVATVVVVVFAWRQGWWSRLGRIHHTAVALAAVAFLAVAASYNLI
ncbi:serine hydrolase domain-containing protein [Herbidospora sp. RD11066]